MSAVFAHVSTFGSKALPTSWRAVTLEDIVAEGGVFVDGDWVESKDQDPEGDVRLIQLADVGDGEYRDRSDRFLTSEKALDLGCTFLEPGDLLIARMPDPLGRACIFPGDRKRAVTVVDVAVVRSRNPELNTRWLMYCINAPQFRRAVASLQSGSTRRRISRKNLSKIVFSLPPRHWQDEVVAEIEKQISRHDVAVANLKRVKADLQRYKAAVLKAAVEGHLINGSVSEEWRRARVADVARIISGLTKNPKRTALPRKLPYLRVANVYANELRLNEIEYIGVADSEIEKLLLQRDDLLVVEGNGSVDQIGRVALWDGSITDCVHQNHLIKVRFGADVLPRWALAWLLSPGGRHEIEQVSSSTSGLHTLSTGKIGRLPIPVPPLADQRRIVAEVDRRLSIVGEVEAELERNVLRAAALKAAILDRHFGSNWSTTNG